MPSGWRNQRLRKAKVALASVVAAFCLYGGKELLDGSRGEGLRALLIAAVAGAGLGALLWTTRND